MKKTFSLKNVFTLQNIVIMGMLLALKVVLRSVGSIYITPQFQAFNISYLPSVVVGTLFGPWAGIIFGGLSDIVGYFAKPEGPFFFGYTLSEMVCGFIYGVFLFNRQPVHWWRAVASRALITLTVFFGLNFIWASMMYGQSAGKFFNSVRLINNLIQFPVHVVLIIAISKLSARIDKELKLTKKVESTHLR